MRICKPKWMGCRLFVGYYESALLCEKSCKPYAHWRYADDTFSIVKSINDATAFHTQLNSLHSSFQFTMEVESDDTAIFGRFG